MEQQLLGSQAEHARFFYLVSHQLIMKPLVLFGVVWHQAEGLVVLVYYCNSSKNEAMNCADLSSVVPLRAPLQIGSLGSDPGASLWLCLCRGCRLSHSVTPPACQATCHTWQGNQRPGLISGCVEKDGEWERKERGLKIKMKRLWADLGSVVIYS